MSLWSWSVLYVALINNGGYVFSLSNYFLEFPIYYEIDEDDNPDLLPKHCPFCGYKEPEEDFDEDWDDIDDT